jgi:hypothetical protein
VKLLSEPGLRRQLAVNGRTHAIRNFDWGIIASRYGRLLDELVPLNDNHPDRKKASCANE